MPCRLPLAVVCGVWEIGMRVEPEHEEGLPILLGPAAQAGDRASGQAVIAAQEDRHPPPPPPRMPRRTRRRSQAATAGAFLSPPWLRDGGSRAADTTLPRSTTSSPSARSALRQSRNPQRSRPPCRIHPRPAPAWTGAPTRMQRGGVTSLAPPTVPSRQPVEEAQHQRRPCPAGHVVAVELRRDLYQVEADDLGVAADPT